MIQNFVVIMRCDSLAGRELTVAYGETRPTFWKESDGVYDGHDFMMMQYIATALHLRLKFVPSIGNAWGVRGLGANGTFSGMIGMVERGVKDVFYVLILYRDGQVSFVIYPSLYPSLH